jgi:hypothetical protein
MWRQDGKGKGVVFGGTLLSGDTVYPSQNFTKRNSQCWSTLHPLSDVLTIVNCLFRQSDQMQNNLTSQLNNTDIFRFCHLFRLPNTRFTILCKSRGGGERNKITFNAEQVIYSHCHGHFTKGWTQFVRGLPQIFSFQQNFFLVSIIILRFSNTYSEATEWYKLNVYKNAMITKYHITNKCTNFILCISLNYLLNIYSPSKHNPCYIDYLYNRGSMSQTTCFGHCWPSSGLFWGITCSLRHRPPVVQVIDITRVVFGRRINI